MALDKKVDVFVSKYSANAKQRSKDWYALTKSTIGGSEIAVIMGLNKYKSKYDLAKEKVGLSPGFEGNMATRWGTVFEDIIARFIELDCNTDVKGAELTINEIPGLRYSPDGYAVVKIHNEDGNITLVNKDHPCFIKHDLTCSNCSYIIVLLEIKCPRTRKPVEGEIPEHYKPQLLSGLTFSPITSMALFTEAVIKRSTLSNILNKDSIAWGLIGIYDSKPLNVDPNNRNIINTHIGDVYDLGKSKLDDLDFYLKKVCDNELTSEYTDPLFEEDGQTLEPLLDDLKSRSTTNKHLIAVLPWVISEIYYTFMERDPNYLQKMIAPLTEFVDLVANLKKDPNYIEKVIQKEDEQMQDDYSTLFIR